VSACDPCLRRSALIGILVAPIASLLDGGRRVPAILSLSEEELLEAAGKAWRERARAEIERFDPSLRRLEVEEAGLYAICVHDPAYPPRLVELPDAPAVLYGAGSQSRFAELIEEPAVAIVGARRASAYGLEVARELGRGLSAARVTVVSGLALGIDAAAHRGAADSGCNTIAVLACGPERAYPRTNRALYDRIAREGAVLAELPPGTDPRRWTFPARNRIMAGLAELTIVVEAAERSGSLITARFAEDAGRDVGAVPGRVTARMAAGSNRLLFDGAHFIRDPGDVLDVLFGAGVRREPPPPRRVAPPDVDDELRRVLEAVEGGTPIESAGADLGLSAAEARAALGRLELLGLVRRDGLGAYERAVGP
jgi:DNA processing protein